MQPGEGGLVSPRQQLVEHVEVPLPIGLVNDPGLLQQVVDDIPSNRGALEVELDVHVLAKAAGVVIADGLGVAEGLEDRVAMEKFVFDALHIREMARPGGNVFNHFLGGFGLSGTRLA